MEEPMTNEAEALDLIKRTHDWANNLRAAGLEENAIAAAMISAVAERMLANFGVDGTAGLLRRHADLIEAAGPALLTEMKRGK
jgi:hypothetical protein